MAVRTKFEAIEMAFLKTITLLLLLGIIWGVIWIFIAPFIPAFFPGKEVSFNQFLWIHGIPLTVSIVCLIVSCTRRVIDVHIGETLFLLVPTVIGGIVAILIAYPLLLYISVTIGLLLHELKEEWAMVGITIPGPPPTAPDLNPHIGSGPINRREHYKSKM